MAGPVHALEGQMFRIFGRSLSERGDVASTKISGCTFEKRNDAVCYLDKLTQLLRPDAGYEAEQDYWWVRNKDGITRYTIQA
jgi:hypothetical protein